MLLVANTGISDGPFHQSVVLLTAYGPHGTEGVIINRASPVTLAEALPGRVDEALAAETVAYGGPVSVNSLRLLIYADRVEGPARLVIDRVFYSANAIHLNTLLSESKHFSDLRFFAGYAGWLPGQLENEIRRGDWQVWPGSAELIFESDLSQLWQQLHQSSSGNWVFHDDTPRE